MQMFPPDAQDGSQNSQRSEGAFCARSRPRYLDEIDKLPRLEGGRLARCVAHREVAEIAQSVVKQSQRYANGGLPPQQVVESAGCCSGPALRNCEEEGSKL